MSNFDVLFSCTVSTNCAESYKSGQRKNGVYTINPEGSEVIKVFCDQSTAGGVVSVPEETGGLGEFLP